MGIVLPFISKILFALSAITLLITAIVVIINWRKYQLEYREYQHRLAEQELRISKEKRKLKEAEVIRLYNESLAKQAFLEQAEEMNPNNKPESSLNA